MNMSLIGFELMRQHKRYSRRGTCYHFRVIGLSPSKTQRKTVSKKATKRHEAGSELNEKGHTCERNE